MAAVHEDLVREDPILAEMVRRLVGAFRPQIILGEKVVSSLPATVSREGELIYAA